MQKEPDPDFAIGKILLYIFSIALLSIVAFLYWSYIKGFFIDFHFASLVATVVATGVAAWIGGSASFNSERKRRDNDRRSEALANVNKAIFGIYRIYSDFKRLHNDYIRFHVNDPLRAVKMITPEKDFISSVTFDFDGLNYLVNTKHEIGAQYLVGLLRLQEMHSNILLLIAKRHDTINELYRIRGTESTLPVQDDPNVKKQYDQLVLYTDLFVNNVTIGFKLVEMADNELRSRAESVFEKDDLLTLAS